MDVRRTLPPRVVYIHTYTHSHACIHSFIQHKRSGRIAKKVEEEEEVVHVAVLVVIVEVAVIVVEPDLFGYFFILS